MIKQRAIVKELVIENYTLNVKGASILSNTSSFLCYRFILNVIIEEYLTVMSLK